MFVIGGGQFGGPRCGKTDRPGPSPVTIAPPGDGGVSLAVACSDGSDYAFRLKHDAATHAYLTVAPIEGRNWYGWMMLVLPTADIGRELDAIKSPYFTADLTRRK